MISSIYWIPRIPLVGFLFISILATVTFPPKIQAQTVRGRQVQTINSSWKFVYRDDTLETPSTIDGLDANAWQKINLPHTWNKDDAFDEQPGYDRGVGWYRKSLEIPEYDAERNYYLHFEGANQITDIYLNGRHVKQHVGGYTAFTADISDNLRDDGENELLISVDNRHNPDVPPLDADFTFYGGIYRDVELWSVASLHFSVDTAFGSPGIKVETPEVTEQHGVANVKVGVSHDAEVAGSARVLATLQSPKGEKLAEQIKMVELTESGDQDLSFHFEVSEPQLWSPKHPEQYQVRVKLYQDENLLDELQTTFGFRFYSLDPDRGFVLNGKPMTLRGTNRHQDYPGRGNALSDARHRKDMELIKSMGANFTRLAHYPQDPAVLEAADELGILIWEETPIVNYITESKAFTAHAKHMLREMIRQHYNHPSIVLWGYMNEILLFNEKGKFGATEDSSYVRHLRGLARNLDRIAHEEDPARHTAMAMHYSGIYDRTGLANIPDVAGWNLYFGWYYGGFADLGSFLDKQHREYPNRVLMISEYGSGSDERIHAQNPESFDFSMEYQNRLHESYLKQIQQRDYLAGTAIWIQNDFGSEGRGDSKPHINQKGLMFMDRRPKDAFYRYKAAWSDDPVLHINGQLWNKMVSENESLADTLTIYSNLDRVELQQNGRMLGSRQPNQQGLIHWPVTVKQGNNYFIATGHAGENLMVSKRQVELKSAKPGDDWQLNVGAAFSFIDATGQLWIPDTTASGLWHWQGGKAGGVSSEIQLTNKEPLYQYYQEGMSGFSTNMDEGSYKITLIFSEPEYQNAEKRVFSVNINDEPVVEDLDLAARAGYRTAYSVQKEVKVGSDGKLRITFNASKGEALINGIQVDKVGL